MSLLDRPIVHPLRLEPEPPPVPARLLRLGSRPPGVPVSAAIGAVARGRSTAAHCGVMPAAMPSDLTRPTVPNHRLPMPAGAGDPSGRRPPRPRVPPPRNRAHPCAVMADEATPMLLDVDDFQALRRQGLFGDDGRNPPPGWWDR